MKNLAVASLAFIVALVFAVSVAADQAAYITEKQAKKAVKLLKDESQVRHFCEPCGDTEFETEDIATIEAVKVDFEDYWEVRINGKGVDLAYLYYPRKKDKWMNVAKKLKIEVQDVSKYLPSDDAE